MLNLEVAVHAVNLVISHMDLVHFLMLIILFEPIRFIVAGETSFSGNSSLKGAGHLRMAPLAFHVKTLNIAVVKTDHPLLDDSLWNRMAQCAACRIHSNCLTFEVTENAGWTRH